MKRSSCGQPPGGHANWRGGLLNYTETGIFSFHGIYLENIVSVVTGDDVRLAHDRGSGSASCR